MAEVSSPPPFDPDAGIQMNHGRHTNLIFELVASRVRRMNHRCVEKLVAFDIVPSCLNAIHKYI